MSHEPVPYPNPSQPSLRASDADRSLVTELLGAAYAEGRLDRDEYDTRIQSALSAIAASAGISRCASTAACIHS